MHAEHGRAINVTAAQSFQRSIRLFQRKNLGPGFHGDA